MGKEISASRPEGRGRKHWASVLFTGVQFPYAWAVFSRAWMFLYLCALCGCVQVCKWVYLRLCACKCLCYVCMTACLCVGWRLCMCLPISFLHVLAQLVALCVFLCT